MAGNKKDVAEGEKEIMYRSLDNKTKQKNPQIASTNSTNAMQIARENVDRHNLPCLKNSQLQSGNKETIVT